MGVTIYSWKNEWLIPPDSIDLKVDAESITSLRFSKIIGLSSKDISESFNLREYKIGHVLGAGAFSEIIYAYSNKNHKNFAIEVVDLLKNKDRFERSKLIFSRLQSSDYTVSLYESFVLPDSQIGCLVEDIAQADMMYRRDLFMEGINDYRIRVIAKQLIEIIVDLDKHHVLHDSAAQVDFLYFENSGRIKVGALERATIDNRRKNPLRVVSNVLDSLIWDYGQKKDRPEWLSKEMHAFMNEIRYSPVTAAHAMKLDIFKEIGNKPKLIISTP